MPVRHVLHSPLTSGRHSKIQTLLITVRGVWHTVGDKGVATIPHVWWWHSPPIAAELLTKLSTPEIHFPIRICMWSWMRISWTTGPICLSLLQPISCHTCTGFCRILATSLYGSFSALILPYKEVTELWGLVQCCKGSENPCRCNEFETTAWIWWGGGGIPADKW